MLKSHCLSKFLCPVVLLLILTFGGLDHAVAQEELSVDDQIRLLEEKKSRLKTERSQLENADGDALTKMETSVEKTRTYAASLRKSLEDIVARCEKLPLEPGDNLARAQELLGAGAQAQSDDPHSAASLYREAYTVARAAYDAGLDRRLDRAKTLAIEARQRVTLEMRTLLPDDAKIADEAWTAAEKGLGENKRESAAPWFEKAGGVYAAMVSRYPQRKKEVEEGAVRGKDISGKWVVQSAGVIDEPNYITLKQKGTKISGTTHEISSFFENSVGYTHGARITGIYEHGTFIYTNSKLKWARFHAQISENGNKLVVHSQEITRGDDKGKMREYGQIYIRAATP